MGYTHRSLCWLFQVCSRHKEGIFLSIHLPSNFPKAWSFSQSFLQRRSSDFCLAFIISHCYFVFLFPPWLASSLYYVFFQSSCAQLSIAKVRVRTMYYFWSAMTFCRHRKGMLLYCSVKLSKVCMKVYINFMASSGLTYEYMWFPFYSINL